MLYQYKLFLQQAHPPISHYLLAYFPMPLVEVYHKPEPACFELLRYWISCCSIQKLVGV